jgi:hypothetical protein
VRRIRELKDQAKPQPSCNEPPVLLKGQP